MVQTKSINASLFLFSKDVTGCIEKLCGIVKLQLYNNAQIYETGWKICNGRSFSSHSLNFVRWS